MFRLALEFKFSKERLGCIHPTFSLSWYQISHEGLGHLHIMAKEPKYKCSNRWEGLIHSVVRLTKVSYPLPKRAVRWVRCSASLSVSRRVCQTILLYVFFWVFPQRLNFICRRFGTLYLFHLHTSLWRWNRQSVSKGRHIKFRHGGITQKKAYNKDTMSFA